MGYKKDREFTDKVHNKLAVPQIYSKLGWNVMKYKNISDMDIKHSIDYFVCHNNTLLTIQERFRECKYKKYNDITIRYSRENNKKIDRKESEYFKMEAQYLLYGIIDTNKEEVDKATRFLKWALIDLNSLMTKVDEGQISIDKNNKYTSRIENGRIIAGFNKNVDNSSEFIVLDIIQLVQLFNNEIVVFQEGYIN